MKKTRILLSIGCCFILLSLTVSNIQSAEMPPLRDPRKFFDDRFVRELQTSGFIDALYR